MDLVSPPAVPERIAPRSAAELTSTLTALALSRWLVPKEEYSFLRDRLRMLGNVVVPQQARLAAQLLPTDW